MARRWSIKRVVATAGLATLAAFAGGCSSAGRSQSAPAAQDSYGGLPTFLPSETAQPDGVLTGSADRPALTVQGEAVKAVLGNGTILANVTGPEVPGQGLPYATPATTCTWTVTLSAATTSVPIRLQNFTTLDHLGHVYNMSAVPGQAAPPPIVAPGQTVTFELRTVMIVGEGLMRWSPDGSHIVASWDFEVEND
jgi:hypothetical protein